VGLFLIKYLGILISIGNFNILKEFKENFNKDKKIRNPD